MTKQSKKTKNAAVISKDALLSRYMNLVAYGSTYNLLVSNNNRAGNLIKRWKNTHLS